MVDVVDTTTGEWMWLIAAQEDERMDGAPIHPYIPFVRDASIRSYMTD